MNTLLIVNSSPRSNSVSRKLTRHIAQEWKAKNPGSQIVERDLAAETLPFVTEPWIQASTISAEERTPEQKQAMALSDALIDDLLAADVIVLGVPMHNFSIPASLKAWIDLITRAGKTFSYGAQGPQGLLPSGKKVLAIVSRGGVYGQTSPADFQVPYLRHMLAFIGLTDLTVIDADKQAFGPEAAQQSINEATKALSAIANACTEHMATTA